MVNHFKLTRSLAQECVAKVYERVFDRGHRGHGGARNALNLAAVGVGIQK